MGTGAVDGAGVYYDIHRHPCWVFKTIHVRMKVKNYDTRKLHADDTSEMSMKAPYSSSKLRYGVET